MLLRLPELVMYCIAVLVQTKHLAEEIIAHIRDVAGGDALVSAFTAAKKAVTAVRSERKRRAAVQVCFLCAVQALLASPICMIMTSALSACKQYLKLTRSLRPCTGCASCCALCSAMIR